MNKNIYAMVLALSITGVSFAQDNTPLTNSDRIFETSSSGFQRRFMIDLGKGNKLQVELTDIADLAQFTNMDSVIRVFIQDIEPLKDSLADELSSKRIDYMTDDMGRKKIRLQQFSPKGSSFLVNHGDLAALKLEQDTINFIGLVHYTAKYTLRKPLPATRYYRLSFYLNNLKELSAYPDWKLNDKIINLQKNNNHSWTNARNGAFQNNDKTVTAKQPGGYSGTGDFLTPRISVNAQNYKSYFVPSFSLGIALILSHNNFKRDIGIAWEPNFFFAKTAQGNLQTFRNDFLTLTFGQGPLKDNDPRKESSFITVFSIGYLITRQGEYMDKRSFRIGAGNISIFEGKTKIEPAFYFTDFFRHVTPGLRWVQSF